MNLPAAAATLSLALVSACASSAQRVEAPDGEGIESPTLVPLSAGVWVVENQEEPTFYVEPDFWAFRDSRWYRTAHLGAAWSAAAAANRPAGLPADSDAPAYARYRRDDARSRRALLPYHPGPIAAAEPTRPAADSGEPSSSPASAAPTVDAVSGAGTSDAAGLPTSRTIRRAETPQ